VSSTPDLWDRLPDESTKAYGAFVEFLKIPRDERSFIAAYRTVSGRSWVEQMPGYFRDWTRRYRWLDRAYAYDDAEIEKDLRSLELQRKEARVRQARLGKALQEKGRSLLDRTDELDAASGTSMIIMGQKVENIALGVATEITETNVRGEVNVHGDIGKMLADPRTRGPALALLESLGEGEGHPDGAG
jgi:hypothetical protein